MSFELKITPEAVPHVKFTTTWQLQSGRTGETNTVDLYVNKENGVLEVYSRTEHRFADQHARFVGVFGEVLRLEDLFIAFGEETITKVLQMVEDKGWMR